MARQRKIPKDKDPDDTKPSKTSKNNKKSDSGNNCSNYFYLFTPTVICVSIIFYLYYNYYLENIITTPLNLPTLVADDNKIAPADRYWGSYRSGHYFGMKVRHPHSPVIGLMWFAQKIVDNSLKIRHWCDMGDNLKRYGWKQHDGVNFGIQEIVDDHVTVTTSFVKRPGGDFGGDWTARLTITPNDENDVSQQPSTVSYSFLIYVATDGEGTITPVVQEDNRLVSVNGFSESLGFYAVHFIPRGGTIIRYNFLNTIAPGNLVYLREVAIKNMALYKSKLKGEMQILGLKGNVFNPEDGNVKNGNYIVHQVTVFAPFEMDVVFESESFKNRPNRLTVLVFDEELKKFSEKFQNKFTDNFQLSLKGYSKSEISVAESVLSNTIGGIGYFHGSSLVQSKFNKEPVEYWSGSLYTAVPCRATFPRGFLWDEGFHNLLINRWNEGITKDILGHWLDLMNIEGWIPREQILGEEARARVPKEFVIQRNTNGNPPALLLTFDMLVRRMLAGEIEKDLEFLEKSFYRLKVWFEWFNVTQIGKERGTYRWRGRDSKARNELNPKTLTSGLDDYPRASNPSEDERHVDLRCWVAFAANVMQEIARMIGNDWENYANTYKYLSDNKELEKHHWSNDFKAFCDYGYHSEDVILRSIPGRPEKGKIRIDLKPGRKQFVNSYGYVSLFPFLLQILKPENPLLSKVFEDLRNPEQLWTKYGLRSLSRNAPLYMKYNTEHDGPYWRGPIWININYLVLKALHYYSEIPGPYQDQAFNIYKELRRNVVNNIIKEYNRTGYLWEHYNDKTGKGEGGKPFTGWTATLVLIMAEIY